MQYTIVDDGILVLDADTFDPRDTLTSGQCFRFGQNPDGSWWVCASDQYAQIVQKSNNSYKILTKNPKFFEKYFDFLTNYDIIIDRLGKYELMRLALEYGKGVRLLRQDLLEVLICFIISANNNINRIRKTVSAICQNFGTKTDFGFAFPTLQQLKNIKLSDFVKFGCGYRADYLVDTIYKLTPEFLANLTQCADTQTARDMLLTLKGVGAKVADCILLFGLGRYDVFPVDTWIYKVYTEHFGGKETNRKKIAKWFVQTFGNDSGYCQQYLFYYKRKDIHLV